MAFRLATCAAVIAATTLAGGCSSPFDVPRDAHTPSANALPIEAFVAPESAYRDEPETDKPVAPELTETSTLDEYVRYAPLSRRRIRIGERPPSDCPRSQPCPIHA